MTVTASVTMTATVSVAAITILTVMVTNSSGDNYRGTCGSDGGSNSGRRRDSGGDRLRVTD